jgi:hypothetical protein
MASPTRIARAILTQTPGVFSEEGIAIEPPGALRQDEVDLLLSHFFPFRKDEDADVRAVDSDKLLQVLRLQEQPWDDHLRILLNERPVDELSPGQRSSAMLPLIALSETVPLIIDQPEDKLDTRMVGNTLTKILADLKEHRQIVVATHTDTLFKEGLVYEADILGSSNKAQADFFLWKEGKFADHHGDAQPEYRGRMRCGADYSCLYRPGERKPGYLYDGGDRIPADQQVSGRCAGGHAPGLRQSGIKILCQLAANKSARRRKAPSHA